MTLLRELRLEDLNEEYFCLLDQLSGNEVAHPNLSRITPGMWMMYALDENKKIFVWECDGEIVGTASVLIEHKLLHRGSRVGHIEDVVVDKNTRQKGLGKGLIEACVNFCRKKGCYKIVLDCSDKNVPFYQSCDFYRAENCMRMDIKI